VLRVQFSSVQITKIKQSESRNLPNTTPQYFCIRTSLNLTARDKNQKRSPVILEVQRVPASGTPPVFNVLISQALQVN
jgi:hypothetical protein